MTNGNVISITDRLRESRITYYLHRLTHAASHFEQRLALVCMEREISQRSPEQRETMELAS